MLATLTHFTSLVSMGGALWLAFYLFARGFPNRISMRAVAALLALGLFFWATYNNFFSSSSAAAPLKAALLVAGMTFWYSATLQLLDESARRRLRWLEWGIYLLTAVTILLLLISKPEFSRRQGNELYVAQLDMSLAYLLYSATLMILSVGLLANLFIERKVRITPQGRLFLFASAFPTLAVVYGMFSVFFISLPMPRVIQDALVFSGFFLLGVSVARYQSLIERRTILQDFPVTGLVMLALLFVYIFIASLLGVEFRYFANIVALVIITHSSYDLAREFLERLRIRREERFRKQMRIVRSADSVKQLQAYLQDGLELLCEQLNASAAVIAIRRGGNYLVMAGRNSVEVGSELANIWNVEGQLERLPGPVHNIQWVAGIFEGESQSAIVGIGAPIDRMDYMKGELELLQEFADYAGLVISVDTMIHKESQPSDDKNASLYQVAMRSAAAEMMDTVSLVPDEDLLKITEDGLRKYPDYVKLGQSSLADWLQVEGASQIERGKQVQKVLFKAIDALRPAGQRPEEPLPRNWYNYVVLHDAYVQGVMNREVMARLYISEGTFNRTRRNALRGVARWLVEKNKTGDIKRIAGLMTP
ncbi:MAG: hypothetical protein Q8L87_05855 [Anaerolineales bacterium]|nr:hypothetical protein [Anaerolineales bacterium]